MGLNKIQMNINSLLISETIWPNQESYFCLLDISNHIFKGDDLEVQSEFKNRIRYDYGYLTQITVPSVFTGCNLTNKKLSTAMEIKTRLKVSIFSLAYSKGNLSFA